MVEILRFDEAVQRRARPLPLKASEAGDSFSFWPEVSCGLCLASTQASADPTNAQGKVLFEIFLILGAVAAIAMAVSLFTGAPLAM
jgi:hypothetical protein